MENSQELTFGGKACGVSFNPGQNPEVARIKGAFADLVDMLNERRKISDNSEEIRMLSLAITDLQTSQMWAVKAVTWQF